MVQRRRFASWPTDLARWAARVPLGRRPIARARRDTATQQISRPSLDGRSGAWRLTRGTPIALSEAVHSPSKAVRSERASRAVSFDRQGRQGVRCRGARIDVAAPKRVIEPSTVDMAVPLSPVWPRRHARGKWSRTSTCSDRRPRRRGRAEHLTRRPLRSAPGLPTPSVVSTTRAVIEALVSTEPHPGGNALELIGAVRHVASGPSGGLHETWTGSMGSEPESGRRVHDRP